MERESTMQMDFSTIGTYIIKLHVEATYLKAWLLVYIL